MAIMWRFYTVIYWRGYCGYCSYRIMAATRTCYTFRCHISNRHMFSDWHHTCDRTGVTDDRKGVTCDTSFVTCVHLWHGSPNMCRFYTVIYWRGYFIFTVDSKHAVSINDMFPQTSLLDVLMCCFRLRWNYPDSRLSEKAKWGLQCR